MKKSEFKAYIREEIISTLSENITVISDVEKYIAMLDELKEKFPSGKIKAKSSTLIGDLLDYINSGEYKMNEASSEEVKNQSELNKELEKTVKLKKEMGLEEQEEANIGLADLKERGYEDGENAFDMHFDKSILSNRPDTKAYKEGFVQAIIDSAGSLRLEENEDKEPSKADLKKGDSVSKIGYKLAETSKEMKSLVKKYKDAQEPEKSKLLSRLKELTKIKKELEGLL